MWRNWQTHYSQAVASLSRGGSIPLIRTMLAMWPELIEQALIDDGFIIERLPDNGSESRIVQVEIPNGIAVVHYMRGKISAYATNGDGTPALVIFTMSIEDPNCFPKLMTALREYK